MAAEEQEPHSSRFGLHLAGEKPGRIVYVLLSVLNGLLLIYWCFSSLQTVSQSLIQTLRRP